MNPPPSDKTDKTDKTPLAARADALFSFFSRDEVRHTFDSQSSTSMEAGIMAFRHRLKKAAVEGARLRAQADLPGFAEAAARGKDEADLMLSQLAEAALVSPVAYKAARQLAAGLVRTGEPVPAPLRPLAADVLADTEPTRQAKKGAAFWRRDALICEAVQLARRLGAKSNRAAYVEVAAALVACRLRPASVDEVKDIWEARPKVGGNPRNG